MPQLQRQSLQAHTILLLTGGLCTLLGLFAYVQRVAFAQLFLGARFFFGGPVTNVDGFKLLMVSGGSVLAAVSGIAILVVGVVYAARSSAVAAGAQVDPAAPAPR
jgi:uncharacterized membrane protein